MDAKTNGTRTVYRACNLCEAICGLEIKIYDRKIISIRGDDADPFSRGHICPKAVALKDVHEDPDRVRRPMRRTGKNWREISWDEAFDQAADALAKTILQYGNDAVALYAGNPNVHNFGHLLNFPPLAKLIRTKNIFSASSVDQLPQQLVSYLMFGHQFLIPIPDIDHTNHFLILGANPIASNGSMMTVPDVAKRLKAIQDRGGKVVVIDPRRTETAVVADEHFFIRPGSDAALLAAILNVLLEENLAAPRNTARLNGFDTAITALKGLTAEAVADFVGIQADVVRRIAREFAAAKSSVCYGRMGTTTQAFGTVNQWLIYLINIATGNLDRVGGALVSTPLMPITGAGTRAGGHARWRSRVRGLPETNGELPVATLAEEVLTSGEGQVHAMVTIAGNPVLSTPNGTQLDRACSQLDFMLAIDIFINETTRHATLILPPTSALNHDHFDSVFNAFGVRNTARFNTAIWPRNEDERYDWEIFDGVVSRLASKLDRSYTPPPKVNEVVAASIARSPSQQGITFESLHAAEHGLDLGPLVPSLFDRLETADKNIHCAPPAILADLVRLWAAINAPVTASLTLIGRRHVRSNNSWMHNAHRLVKGKSRHQLLMHPIDMADRNIRDGVLVRVKSRVGEVQIVVEACAQLMPGVISIPHGFGHSRGGVHMQTAQQHAGVSANDLTDEQKLDKISGNAALNGVSVEVSAV